MMTRHHITQNTGTHCSIVVTVPSGFGLVELMISITIGLLTMSGILTLYVNTSRTNQEMEKTTRQIENGSFAIELLVNDISHGGFWESYVPDYEDLTLKTAPVNVPKVIPSPCQDYTTWNVDYKNALLGIPLQIYDDTVPAGCDDIVTHKKAGTDVVVVRHAEATSCQPGAGTCVAGQLYFQSSLCKDEDSYAYVLGTGGFIYHKMNCTTITDARRFTSNIYYIRDYYMTSGDGIPTLMRSQFNLSIDGTLEFQDPVPLVEGIEGFRIELGIDNLSADDTDVVEDVDPLNRYTSEIIWPDPTIKKLPTNRGDGIPDSFIHCPAAGCSLGQLSNIVAAKLYLLVRNQDSSSDYTSDKIYTLGDEEFGPFTDHFKRHVYSTTVRLNNIAGRRETPP